MQIMIVDDNPRIRSILRTAVQPLATGFCECNDGDEVLPLYRTCRPHWVLMDVRMPKVDGLAATRRLLAEYPDANVIIVTNHDDPAMRREAAAAGARGFVSKRNLFDLLTMLHI